MSRFSARRYRIQIFAVMAVYVVVLLAVWPYARHAESMPLKAVLALLPTLPVLVVIGLMVRRVMTSDEFEQRLHLLALSVATGVVAALSLVGGFLAAAHVVAFDGDILIWVFPALCGTYGVARLLFARRYGSSSCE